MGIMANSVSICQFRVVGELPAADLFAWIGECLDRHAFRDIEQTADELSVGWVRTDSYQESDFTATGLYRRDHYVSFTLRRDQRRVPATLLKFRIQQAEQDFLAANPNFFRVPKQKREEIRETAKLSLLTRTLPVPGMFDAVWDTGRGLVTLGSISTKAIDLFESEFKKTFEGLRLVLVHPYARALAVVPEESLPALEQANLASSEAVLDLIRSNCWLGQDFLLWLLYRSLSGSAEFSVITPGIYGAGEPFTAFVNDRLLLTAKSEAGPQKITVAGSQDEFSEVLAALRLGKGIAEATLHLEKDENCWKLSLKGEMFHFGSFKSPAVQLEKDAGVDRFQEEEAVFFERMHLLESGLQLFDSIYAEFLEVRLGDSWPAVAAAIREWLDGED